MFSALGLRALVGFPSSLTHDTHLFTSTVFDRGPNEKDGDLFSESTSFQTRLLLSDKKDNRRAYSCILIMEAKSLELLHWAEDAARNRDLLHSFVYGNYAWRDQDVMNLREKLIWRG